MKTNNWNINIYFVLEKREYQKYDRENIDFVDRREKSCDHCLKYIFTKLCTPNLEK
jgi:hypothetical protein